MFSLLLAVCLLCEAFLLRFLLELAKASRDARREGNMPYNAQGEQREFQRNLGWIGTI
jgi:hypothetical protein